jgi:hypothetical protein
LRARSAAILVPVLLATSGRGAEASVVITARVLDGETTSRRLLEAFRENRSDAESQKVPWGDRDVAFTLAIVGAAPGTEKTWSARTDAAGAVTVDTGLPSIPEGGYFLATGADPGGRKVYSPFFRPDGGRPVTVSLYPTTESPADLSGQLVVAYDTHDIDRETKHASTIRVRVRFIAFNRGGEMYVGRKAGSPWREVWRVPFPRDAKILANRGPDAGTPGWTVSGDGRWLLVDSPVPGLADLDRFGRSGWEVHYAVPARQELVQSYPVAFAIEANQLQFWSLAKDMKLSGPKFFDPGSRTFPDPFTGNETVRFEATGGREDFRDGSLATIAVTADNAAIGQISLSAVKWVGGFVLVVVLSILLGLALGARGRPPDALFAGLSGEEVLDRIADLDRRHARGEISEKDYQRHREVLVELAAEELGEEAAAAGARGKGGAPPPPVSPAVREILARIDEIERNGAADPARIAERAHLLEALAKALPRGEAPRG